MQDISGQYYIKMPQSMLLNVMSVNAWEKPTQVDEMSLQPQVSLQPFEKWGLYFLAPINPPSNHKEYNLVCIQSLKKWVEVKPLKNVKEDKVVEFYIKKSSLDSMFHER
jgi:hypothetical protein